VNPQLLFNKLESIVLDYVREIRKHVLERFHTCSKTSHDVQLFISFLLDEYQLFIQAANNVAAVVSYLVCHLLSLVAHPTDKRTNARLSFSLSAAAACGDRSRRTTT
jgi:hypothetical protein